MNAIILAAGIGSRLSSYTISCAKPLIRVEGIPIIERQIECLNMIGVKDIYVVVGYLNNQFEYLRKKYGVHLIFNEEYFRYNNIYSFHLCRKYFGNSWVLDGDVFLKRNFLSEKILSSTYFTGRKKIIQPEWELIFDKQNKLNKIKIHQNPIENYFLCTPTYIMSGISYWTEDSAEIILRDLQERISVLSQENTHPIGKQYWDQLILDNLDKLNIKIEIIKSNDWMEIDCEQDLMNLHLAKS